MLEEDKRPPEGKVGVGSQLLRVAGRPLGVVGRLLEVVDRLLEVVGRLLEVVGRPLAVVGSSVGVDMLLAVVVEGSLCVLKQERVMR